MAGSGRGQPANFGGSGPPPAPSTRPGSGSFGQQFQPPLLPSQQAIPISVVLIEQKLASQHAEIQKLLTENQRLAATHVALRQELAAAHHEVQRLQQLKSGIQAEGEGEFLALLEKTTKLEADLNEAEPLKAELEKARDDAQQLSAHKEELLARVEQLTHKLQRPDSDAQHPSALELENENLRRELHRGRVVFEYEKKSSLQQDEQKQAMEKTLILLAKEVEKLHAELTSTKKHKTSSSQGLWAGEAGYSFPYGVQRDEYKTVENDIRYSSDLSFPPNSADTPEASHEGDLNINGQNSKMGETNHLDELKYQAEERVYTSLSPNVQNVDFSKSERQLTEIWNTHVAPSGKAFYHNTLTGLTQWDRPAALEISESRETDQTQNHQQFQEQIQGAALQMQQPAGEMSQLRQLQMQLYGEALQGQEQQVAYSQIHPHLESQYMQPTRSQYQGSPSGQGHMYPAGQMSQFIQGQLAYPAQGQRLTSYQISSQSPGTLQAQGENHLQSKMPSQFF
ncbi:hypothetical protein O6H91_16G073900 [Diphasiastrum complanatum]|uniref:Uncharacterized protein n=1 Tax=Diphasiastrum complanatum TaxID=34168 RepID=A0ACC2BDJ2_DIPCM|nr:hypothetical protein O6H91_16G073900 [Diphasiastrum complanatum]